MIVILKRKLCKFMATLLIASQCTSIVSYATGTQSGVTSTDAVVIYDNEIKKQVFGQKFSRLREACDKLNDEDTTQANMLLYLTKLEEFGLYLWAIEQANDITTNNKLFSNDLLDYYKNSYNTCCLWYNNKYGNGSSDLFTALQTEGGKLEAELSAKPNVKYENNTFASIPQYLKNSYHTLKEYPLEDNTSNNSNYRCLYGLYKIFIEADDELKNMGMSGITKTITLDGEESTFNDFITLLKTDYNDSIEKGKGLQEVIGKPNQSISVNLEQKPLENFANVSYDVDEGYYSVPDTIELSAAYLALFSASSIYVPFQSYAGSEEFLSSIRTLVPDSTTADDLINLYNDTKNKRKPLYKQDVDVYGNPIGTASIVTLEDFIRFVKEDVPVSLNTVTGELALDTTSASWVYREVKNSSASKGLDSLENLDTIVKNLLTDEDGDTSTGDVKAEVDDTSKDESYSVIIEEYNTLPAYEEITEINKITKPILFSNNTVSRSTDNFTFALLKNIIVNNSILDNIKHPESRYVYLNAYGDIVLDDNLVILPGAANPLYYEASSAYPTYTAAFMNTYPSIIEQSKFGVMNKKQIGRYAIKSEDDEVILAEITSTNTIGETLLKAPDLTFSFSTEPTWKSGLRTTMKLHGMEEGTFCILDVANVVNGKSLLFPYSTYLDPGYDTAQAIVYNFYNYLMRNTETDEELNQGKLKDDYLYHNVITSGLDGTELVEVYTNYTLTQYEKFEEGSYDRFNTSLLNVIKSLEQKLGTVKGVLSLRNAFNLEYLGTALNVLRENVLTILLVVAVFVIICFVRNAVDIIKMGAMLGVVIGSLFLFILYAPGILTYGFNIFTNLISEELAYKIVAVCAEVDSVDTSAQKYVAQEGVGEDSTSSVTLYRFNENDLDTMTNELGIKLSEVSGGNIHLLNERSGVYVQNDSIKMNLDTLLNTLVIEGSYVSEGDNSIYKMESYKTQSNVLDYYTPYYQIVDGFIGKLNDMIEVFDMIPTKSSYSQQVYRDNFAVYSYTNSPMFLTPGEYTYSLDSKYYADSETDEKIREEYYNYNDELVAKIEEAFGENKDWLGISSVFVEVSNGKQAKEYQKTLWAKAMQKAGYYNDDWSINEEELAELIYYVNLQTKKFIIGIEPLIGEVSDEVLIELISLRALSAMNQRVSEFKNMTYPLYINFDEIALKDVLTVVMMDGYTTMFAEDASICDYVMQRHGWFNLVIFAIIIVTSFVFAAVINMALPVIYVSYMFLLIFKFANYKDIKPLTRGFVKMFGILFIDYCIFCGGIVLISNLRGNVIGLWLLMAITLFCTWLLGLLLMSLFSEFTNLGDTAVNVRVSNLLNKISPKLEAAQNLNVASMNVAGDNENNSTFTFGGFEAYADNAEIDNMYNATEDSLFFTEEDIR